MDEYRHKKNIIFCEKSVGSHHLSFLLIAPNHAAYNVVQLVCGCIQLPRGAFGQSAESRRQELGHKEKNRVLRGVKGTSFILAEATSELALWLVGWLALL